MSQHQGQGQSAQYQEQQPGRESQMQPQPATQRPAYRGSGKLQDKIAIIIGGDSGIGHAVAVAFAKEGADVAVVYLNESEDAQRVKQEVEQQGRRCLLLAGDVGKEAFCQQAVEQTVETFGTLDILVNNAAEQHPQQNIEQISEEQLERTFRTNIFAQFFLVKAALKHLGSGSAIINTTSVTAYQGAPQLLDYSTTKGAIVAFTRSLSQGLVEKGIRVNGVAPGPIWTPLIPARTGRNLWAGGADETSWTARRTGPRYVFLACEDSSYMSGQILHLNGGTIVNG